jgi:hypothetical protein
MFLIRLLMVTEIFALLNTIVQTVYKGKQNAALRLSMARQNKKHVLCRLTLRFSHR